MSEQTDFDLQRFGDGNEGWFPKAHKEQAMSDEKRSVDVTTIERWRMLGVTVHEGPYLPTRTMVVSTDLMDDWRKLSAKTPNEVKP